MSEIVDVHGVKMCVEYDAVVRAHRQSGCYEPELMKRWGEVCAGPGVVVDAGAYSGLFSIKAAMLGATVHAFEMHPFTFELLLSNVERNGVDVACHLVALWDKVDELKASTYPDRPASSSATLKADHGSKFKVDAVTLDSMKLSGVKAIKIDVERSEGEVILGALATIRRDKPFIFTEILDSDSIKNVSSLLVPLGYSGLRIEAYMYEWRHSGQ